MHIETMLSIEDIPRDAIFECSHPGPCDADVENWCATLGLTVDRQAAIDCLTGYGAWDREELAAKSDTDLAEIVLWIAAGDFREYLTAVEAGDYEVNPITGEPQTDTGSDVFVLEG